MIVYNSIKRDILSLPLFYAVVQNPRQVYMYQYFHCINHCQTQTLLLYRHNRPKYHHILFQDFGKLDKFCHLFLLKYPISFNNSSQFDKQVSFESDIKEITGVV